MKAKLILKILITCLFIVLFTCCTSKTGQKAGTEMPDTIQPGVVEMIEPVRSVPEEAVAVEEPVDTTGLKASFNKFLVLFDTNNEIIPDELVKIFLSGIDKSDMFEAADMECEIKTDKKLPVNKNYVALQCRYDYGAPGRTADYTYLLTYKPDGRTIENFRIGMSLSGDYFGKVTYWKFLNDSVFITYSLESSSDLEFKKEDAPPEYKTKVDTIGQSKYLITSEGKIVFYDEYVR